MRRGFIVSYDVSDPRRLQRVRRVLVGFGDPLQLSVFYCELTASEMVILRDRLSEVIHAGEDQVLFADLGGVEHACEAVTTLGRARESVERSAIVV